MNLTTTARITRRVVAATIVFLITLTAGQILWKVGYAVYRYFFPPQKPPPEVAFGKIPTPNFKGLKQTETGWTYELDTTTGRLPSMPDRLPVFPIEKSLATPLNEEKARELAQRLGFESPPKEIGFNLFRWKSGYRTLEMNIVSKHFILSSDLDVLEFRIPIGTTIQSRDAEEEANHFLSIITFSDTTLNTSRKETLYQKIEDGELEQVESVSEAQMTRVDFFKAISIDNNSYPILGPKPKEGLTQISLSGQAPTLSDNYPLVKYRNWKLENDKGSTYPLLSSTTAWEKFKNGEATVTRIKPQEAGPYDNPSIPLISKVRVQEVYLAYFESPDPIKYIQPMYVFEGLAEIQGQKPWEFFAYLPATTEEWLQ